MINSVLQVLILILLQVPNISTGGALDDVRKSDVLIDVLMYIIALLMAALVYQEIRIKTKEKKNQLLEKKIDEQHEHIQDLLKAQIEDQKEEKDKIIKELKDKLERYDRKYSKE